MITYERKLSDDHSDLERVRVTQHVIDHIRSVADDDDNPDTDLDVSIRLEVRETGVYVIGSADAEPSAPYLREGYDPDEEDA